MNVTYVYSVKTTWMSMLWNRRAADIESSRHAQGDSSGVPYTDPETCDSLTSITPGTLCTRSIRPDSYSKPTNSSSDAKQATIQPQQLVSSRPVASYTPIPECQLTHVKI